ncbi:hypothetical protein ABT392_09505 [Paucibacter sp. JuS9]|uniref:hypothetical protein n=1 Tax=Paucibacter sp. JuS9 TaxID=3228748 RepID=UPI0037570D62
MNRFSHVLISVAIGAASLPAWADNFDLLSGSGTVSRSQLGYSYLTTSATDPGSLIDVSAYALPATAAHPTNFLQGTLALNNTATSGGFQEVVDTNNYTSAADATRKHLPPFAFQYIQTGSHIFPLQRGAIASTHPEWEYVLAPGRVWNETSDSGYSRVALPFALMQKNQNCVHNGVMSFLFKADGTISKLSYQISSETCSYFKVNMWGVLSASYTPQQITNAASLITAYQAEVAARMPVRPLSALATDYPSSGINVQKLRTPSTTVAAHVSTVGFISDGVHYRGGCTTRYGEYPYCDQLILPSYSTAKSAFGALALMRLEKKYPGTKSQAIKTLVSNCNITKWNGVTIEHALDMASGNYTSTSYEVDEGGTAMSNNFFLQTGHANRINFACTQWPAKVAPGSKWVYHTSDTYLAGTAMNAYLKSVEGSTKDIYTDIVAGDLWSAINASPTAKYTRRTYDTTAQPLTGYGLVYLPDDVAKIASFAGINMGVAGGVQLLDTTLLNAALQKTPADPGLVATTDTRYNNGFWAYNVKSSLACASDKYVPFMSGFGGITIALMPNNTIYYMFNDNSQFLWVDAVKESAKIRAICT